MLAKFDTHIHHLMKTPLDESLASFKKVFDITGVQKMAFMSIPHEKSEGTDYTQNLKSLFFKDVFSSDGYAFAGLVHNEQLDQKEQALDFIRQAEIYAAVGFDGIKMLEGKPSCRRRFRKLLSDDLYDGFFGFLEENGIPVTLHNADPACYWDKSQMTPYQIGRGWFCGPDLPTKDGMFEDVIAVLRRHPRLKLTMAHFGFLTDNKEQAKLYFDGFENTMVDLTPGGEQFFQMLEDKDFWIDFIEKHDTRIKYGTDTYNNAIADEQLWEMRALPRPTLLRNFFETDTEHTYFDDTYRGIALSPDRLGKIYMQNALMEYGAPKKIDMAYVKKELETLETIYADDADTMYDINIMKDFWNR